MARAMQRIVMKWTEAQFLRLFSWHVMGSVSVSVTCDAAPNRCNSNRMDTRAWRLIASLSLETLRVWTMMACGPQKRRYSDGSQHIPIMPSSHDSLRHILHVTSWHNVWHVTWHHFTVTNISLIWDISVRIILWDLKKPQDNNSVPGSDNSRHNG